MSDDDRTRPHIVISPGTEIRQYRILEKIGAGGMGEVFLAEDTALDRRVALKFMPTEFAGDSSLRARFMREAKAMAKLNHLNVVTVHEVGEYNDRPFIAMEHLEGSSLREVAQMRSLEMPEVLSVAIEICNGLKKAHSAGIVHRDIKPSNIVLDADGHPKIIDFGLSMAAGDDKITKTGSTLGTVSYMSPEQAAGKDVDHRSDLWSLGVVMYEFIAGRTPFEAETKVGILEKIRTAVPEPLARYKADVPTEMERIVSKLLQKSPNDRYQSSADLETDLNQQLRLFGAASASQVATATSVKRNQSAVARRVAFAALLIAIVAIAVVLLKPWSFRFSALKEAEASESKLAVMYFDNLVDPDDKSRYSEMIANLLITDLSEIKGIRIISTLRLYDILADMGQSDNLNIDRATASEVARRAGARWMLTGTLLQTEPNFVITAQMIDVTSGAIDASEKVTGKLGEDIFAQVEHLTTAVLSNPLLSEKTSSPSPSITEMTTNSETAYRLYLEGEELLRKSYTFQGLAKLREAVKVDSSFAVCWYRIDIASFDKEANAQAVKFAENASPLQRRHIYARSDKLNGNWSECVAQLKDITRDYPEDLEAYQRLASLFSDRKGMSDQSIFWLKRLLEVNPESERTYNSIAYYYKSQKQYDSALVWVEKYCTLVPDEPNPYDSRGEILAAMGRVDQAIDAYKKAMDIDRSFYSAFRSLFDLYTLTGDFKAATACIDSLRSSPVERWRTEALVLPETILMLKGRYDEAINSLSERKGNSSLLELTHSPLEIYLHQLRGHYEQTLEMAIARRDTIEVLIPNNGYPGERRIALALATMGKTDSANSVIRYVIDHTWLTKTLKPPPYVQIYAARVFLELGLCDSSVHYSRDAQQYPGGIEPSLYYWAGKCLLDCGEVDEAIEQFISVMTRIEDMGWSPVALAHYQLGVAYEQKGELQKAMKHTRTFLEWWKNADPDLPELLDGKARYERLQENS